MDTLENQQIPLFDELKLQLKVILPILENLRKEMGKEKADNLIAETLRPQVRSWYLEIGQRKSGSPYEKWCKVWDELRPRIGNNVERDVKKDDETGRDYNVTKCRFADYFKSIGEPQLGRILLCDYDYYIAEIGAPVVELTRTQTIMEGADYCDFCYKVKIK